MKQICAFILAAIAAFSCRASALSDAINAEVVKSTMPVGGASAVVSPYAVAFMSGLLGDGMDSRELRIALGEKMGLKTTDFGPTFQRSRSHHKEWGLTNRVEVLFANSLWMRNYSRIEREFHTMAHRVYDVAFGPLTGVLPINAWTSAKTDGLVSKAIDDVDLSCDTVIVSASGFNGAWARPFLPARQGVFHAKRGDVQLPMMSDIRTLRTLKRPGYKAASIMYRGEKLALFVLIPDEGNTTFGGGSKLVPEELDLLDRAFLPEYRPEDDKGNPMADVEGSSVAVTRITLPKFRGETTVDALPAFAALGVQRTGYDAICKGMRIGAAVQHNVFETSETGGEVGMVDLPEVKGEGEPAKFVCDRPFVFLVRTVEHLTLLVGFFNGD